MALYFNINKTLNIDKPFRIKFKLCLNIAQAVLVFGHSSAASFKLQNQGGTSELRKLTHLFPLLINY